MCASTAEIVRVRSCNVASDHSRNSCSETVEWVMLQARNIQTAEPLVD